MRLLASQWEDIEGRCQTIMEVLPFELLEGGGHSPFTVRDARDCEWQGSSEDMARYTQVRTRTLVAGEWALHTTVRHALLLTTPNNGHYKLIMFDIGRRKISNAYFGREPRAARSGDMSLSDTNNQTERLIPGYRTPWPGGHARLYEEIQRGAGQSEMSRGQ